MVLNIAHRGARSLAPENTLLAARRGFDCGAHLWETDLAVSRDEALILFHDDRLGRTTNVADCFPERAEDPFTTFFLEELRRLDAGSWFLDDDPFGQIAAGALTAAEQHACQGAVIPTLEEALVLTRDLGWRLNLELKFLPSSMKAFPVVPRVLAMIDRVGLGSGDIVISSFNHEWLREVKACKPEIAVQALVGYNPDGPLDWGDMTFETYNVRSTLISAETVRQRVASGLAINLFTVNATEDMQRFAAAGAAGIITDFPQRLAGLAL
ncbi:MAG: glycerophosphodiester phosphodiesterase family protein [Desulfobacterales bacterium]|nr:glycerophosphodiester phosphodiesterase family protein [Desulfobacterales bacterium]